MTLWVAKYTDRQRDAVAHAWNVRGIRPASRVVAAAAAGDLELDGERLDAFEISESSVRDLARKDRNRRAGKAAGTLAAGDPLDAIEAIRRRLLGIAEHELAALERGQKAGKPADGEAIRRLAKAAQEIRRIPDRSAPANPRPGARPGEKHAADAEPAGPDSSTLGDLAAGMTAADPPIRLDGDTGNRDADTTPASPTTTDTGQEGDNGDAAGLSVRGALRAIAGDAASAGA